MNGGWVGILCHPQEHREGGDACLLRGDAAEPCVYLSHLAYISAAVPLAAGSRLRPDHQALFIYFGLFRLCRLLSNI